jgi:hypothetical protein
MTDGFSQIPHPDPDLSVESGAYFVGVSTPLRRLKEVSSRIPLGLLADRG